MINIQLKGNDLKNSLFALKQIFFYQKSIILKEDLVRGVEMQRPLEKVILPCHLKAVLF